MEVDNVEDSDEEVKGAQNSKALSKTKKLVQSPKKKPDTDR